MKQIEGKVQELIFHMMKELQREYTITEEEAYQVLFGSLENNRAGIVLDSKYLIEEKRTSF